MYIILLLGDIKSIVSEPYMLHFYKAIDQQAWTV